MKARYVIVAFAALCGCTSANNDPTTSANYCAGGCASNEVCVEQTAGVKDGGSYSYCAPFPDACAPSCACLLSVYGGCCANTCGVNNGLYEIHCMGC